MTNPDQPRADGSTASIETDRFVMSRADYPALVAENETLRLKLAEYLGERDRVRDLSKMGLPPGACFCMGPAPGETLCPCEKKRAMQVENAALVAKMEAMKAENDMLKDRAKRYVDERNDALNLNAQQAQRLASAFRKIDELRAALSAEGE